jgi:hypothetical protein
VKAALKWTVTFDWTHPQLTYSTKPVHCELPETLATFHLSELGISPLKLSTWVNVWLLSYTSTLPLPNPTWILRILQWKKISELSLQTMIWPWWANPNVEPRKIRKNEATWFLQKSIMDLQWWNWWNPKFKRMIIRMINGIKQDMNKHLTELINNTLNSRMK